MMEELSCGSKPRAEHPDSPPVKLVPRRVVPNHMISDDIRNKSHPNYSYAPNRIQTTKYTLLTLIPKNLFEQFHRFANLYFLGIQILNWIPGMS